MIQDDPPAADHATAPPVFPTGMLTVGRIPAALLRWGVPMGPLRLLTTTGRSTGREHQLPVVVLRHDGADWLVSPFGDVAWVKNVRANDHARLGRGRRWADVTLAELDPSDTAVLLRTYRRRFGAIPFVRAAFDATGKDPVETFAAEADRHPVFAIEPSPSAS